MPLTLLDLDGRKSAAVRSKAMVSVVVDSLFSVALIEVYLLMPKLGLFCPTAII